MPDNTPLKLDLDTERVLKEYIHDDIARGRFRLEEGRTFVLDAHGGDPGRSEMIGRLKDKLGFIDFDAGGLKLLEVNINGNPARFTLVPRWEMPPPGVKGLGGPSIGLRFTMHF